MPFSWTPLEILTFLAIYTPIMLSIWMVKGQVSETLNRVKENAKNQYSKREQDELFYQSIRSEISNFRVADMTQLEHCRNHGILIQDLTSDHREIKLVLRNMEELIRDVKKSLDANATAMTNNAQVNMALLDFLRNLKKDL